MKSPTAPLVVLGSFVAALTVKVGRLPTAGESLLASAYDLSAGGKGFNQAVGAHRLGAAVSLLLAVGDDLFAQLARTAVQAAGLHDVTWRAFSGPTGTGVGFIDAEGENCLAVAPGANWLLTADDIAAIAGPLAQATLVAAQFEIPDAPIAAAFAQARRHDAITLLNPSPWRPPPPEVLANTTVLVLNQVEAQAMGASRGIAPVQASRRAQAQALAPALLALGPELVVITLGREGAMAFPRGQPPVFQPAFPVNAIDSTGAGDAFVAALAVALSQQMPLAQCLQRAAAAGALVTQRLGVYDALPGLVELDAFLRKVAPKADDPAA